MGFGGLFKKQNQLTDLSNSLAVKAGVLKQEAAAREAAALRAQGDIAYQQAQEEQALFRRENALAAGQQAEAYLSSGVSLAGTPLAILNETRRLGQFKLDAIEQQGRALQDLAQSRAAIVEHGGLAEYLAALGGADINSSQNEISQRMEKGSFYRSLFGGLAYGGLSILSGLIHG
jgi:hypothetical protein